MQASRKTCLEMQDGKAAEFTVTYALDYYRQSYQKQYTAMLRGEVYSKMAMDNALENIMKIACDDEAHIRYGEILAEQDAVELDFSEPEAPLPDVIELETRNDMTWLPPVEVTEKDDGIEWRIGNDVIFGSKEWFDNIPDEPTNSPAPDGAGTGE